MRLTSMRLPNVGNPKIYIFEKSGAPVVIFKELLSILSATILTYSCETEIYRFLQKIQLNLENF